MVKLKTLTITGMIFIFLFFLVGISELFKLGFVSDILIFITIIIFFFFLVLIFIFGFKALKTPINKDKIVYKALCPECGSMDVDETIHGYTGVSNTLAKFYCRDCGHASNVFPEEFPENVEKESSKN